MKNVAIIGAGEIGSRHLQALAKLKNKLTIYLVDPSDDSLKISNERFQLEDYYKNKELHFGRNYGILPPNIDFVIIATTSIHRLAALQAVTSKSKIKYLLLEKFLFPHIDEYSEAQSIIRNNNIKGYVNCPRRVWPIYKSIKENISGDKIINLSIDGARNLASNSIHFLDLFFYLTMDEEVRIDTSELDQKILPNKRHGFVEFTGKLTGISENKNEFSLHSNNTSSTKVVITINTNHHEYKLFEGDREVWILKEGSWIKENFQVPMQSETTHIIFKQLMDEDNCDLVRFEESVNHHLYLLTAFNEFLGDRKGMIT